MGAGGGSEGSVQGAATVRPNAGEGRQQAPSPQDCMQATQPGMMNKVDVYGRMHAGLGLCRVCTGIALLYIYRRGVART